MNYTSYDSDEDNSGDVVQKIPVGHRIIGMQCNSDKKKISDISFILWAPPKDSLSSKQLKKFEMEEAELNEKANEVKKHNKCLAYLSVIPSLVSLAQAFWMAVLGYPLWFLYIGMFVLLFAIPTLFNFKISKNKRSLYEITFYALLGAFLLNLGLHIGLLKYMQSKLAPEEENTDDETRMVETKMGSVPLIYIVLPPFVVAFVQYMIGLCSLEGVKEPSVERLNT